MLAHRYRVLRIALLALCGFFLLVWMVSARWAVVHESADHTVEPSWVRFISLSEGAIKCSTWTGKRSDMQITMIPTPGWSAHTQSWSPGLEWPKMQDGQMILSGFVVQVRSVSLPLWLPLAIAAMVTAGVWVRGRKHPPGHCARCGYDLREIESGRCPECGTACESVPPAS